MKARLVTALFAASACGRTVAVPLALPDGAAYTFVAIVDGAGDVTRELPVSGPGLAGLPHLELTDAERGVVVLTIAAADLTAAQTGFDPTRASELALVEADACAEGTILPGGTRARLPLPASARIQRGEVPDEGAVQLAAVDRDAVPWLATRVLELPVDLEHCLGAAPIVLTPFAGRDRPLPRPLVLDGVPLPDLTHADVVRALRLDDQTVLAAARGALYLFERGKPFSERAGNHLLVEDGPPEDRAWITELAADRGGRAVAVTSTRENGGAVLDFDVTPERITAAGTATRTINLKSVVITPAGETVAVGFDGLVAVRRARGEAFTAQRFHELRDSRIVARLIRVALGATPEAALIVGSEEGTVWTAPSPQGPWTASSVARAMLGDSKIYDVRAAGDTLWASGNDGTLFRKPPGKEWEPAPLTAPPSYVLCSRIAGACGRTPPGYSITQIAALPDGALFLVNAQCRGALHYRPRDACTTTVHLAGHPIEASAEDPTSAEVFRGWLTVATDGGGLYELRL